MEFLYGALWPLMIDGLTVISESQVFATNSTL